MVKRQYTARIEEQILKELSEIAKIETEKTGYDITVAKLVNKILSDYCKNYERV